MSVNHAAIGPYKPQSSLRLMTYVGLDPNLQGCTALVADYEDEVVAQFDNRETGYGYGWHLFLREDFELRGEDVS